MRFGRRDFYTLWKQRMPIKIDKKRDELLAEYAVGMLKDFYLKDTKNHHKKDMHVRYSGQHILENTMENLQGNAFMIMFLISGLCTLLQYCLMPLTENPKKKGLPISCFLTYVPDTLEGLIGHSSELRLVYTVVVGVTGQTCELCPTLRLFPYPVPTHCRCRHDCLPSR